MEVFFNYFGGGVWNVDDVDDLIVRVVDFVDYEGLVVDVGF